MRALVATIALALQLAAAPLIAQTTEEAALAHLDRGVAAFRAGAYARAHVELSAAHRLAPDRANPYRWLALTEVQLGDCAHALLNIEGFLARVPPDEPRVAEMVRLRVLCQRTLADQPAGGPPPAPDDRPITRRWWFWPAVIGTAVTAAGIGVYLADDPDATLLPPVRCDPAGCRPGGP